MAEPGTAAWLREKFDEIALGPPPSGAGLIQGSEEYNFALVQFAALTRVIEDLDLTVPFEDQMEAAGIAAGVVGAIPDWLTNVFNTAMTSLNELPSAQTLVSPSEEENTAIDRVVNEIEWNTFYTGYISNPAAKRYVETHKSEIIEAFGQSPPGTNWFVFAQVYMDTFAAGDVLEEAWVVMDGPDPVVDTLIDTWLPEDIPNEIAYGIHRQIKFNLFMLSVTDPGVLKREQFEKYTPKNLVAIANTELSSYFAGMEGGPAWLEAFGTAGGSLFALLTQGEALGIGEFGTPEEFVEAASAWATENFRLPVLETTKTRINLTRAIMDAHGVEFQHLDQYMRTTILSAAEDFFIKEVGEGVDIYGANLPEFLEWLSGDNILGGDRISQIKRQTIRVQVSMIPDGDRLIKEWEREDGVGLIAGYDSLGINPTIFTEASFALAMIPHIADADEIVTDPDELDVALAAELGPRISHLPDELQAEIRRRANSLLGNALFLNPEFRGNIVGLLDEVNLFGADDEDPVSFWDAMGLELNASEDWFFGGNELAMAFLNGIGGVEAFFKQYPGLRATDAGDIITMMEEENLPGDTAVYADFAKFNELLDVVTRKAGVKEVGEERGLVEDEFWASTEGQDLRKQLFDLDRSAEFAALDETARQIARQEAINAWFIANPEMADRFTELEIGEMAAGLREREIGLQDKLAWLNFLGTPEGQQFLEDARRIEEERATGALAEWDADAQLRELSLAVARAKSAWIETGGGRKILEDLAQLDIDAMIRKVDEAATRAGLADIQFEELERAFAFESTDEAKALSLAEFVTGTEARRVTLAEAEVDLPRRAREAAFDISGEGVALRAMEEVRAVERRAGTFFAPELEARLRRTFTGPSASLLLQDFGGELQREFEREAGAAKRVQLGILLPEEERQNVLPVGFRDRTQPRAFAEGISEDRLRGMLRQARLSRVQFRTPVAQRRGGIRRGGRMSSGTRV